MPDTQTRKILNRRNHYVLQQIREKHGAGEQAFVAVVCDNCGRTIQALSVEALVPKCRGWYVDDQVGRAIDYCPECAAKVL